MEEPCEGHSSERASNVLRLHANIAAPRPQSVRVRWRRRKFAVDKKSVATGGGGAAAHMCAKTWAPTPLAPSTDWGASHT